MPSHNASSEVETSITRTFSAGRSASARAIATSTATPVALSLAPGTVPRNPMSAKAVAEPAERTMPAQVNQRRPVSAPPATAAARPGT